MTRPLLWFWAVWFVASLLTLPAEYMAPLLFAALITMACVALAVMQDPDRRRDRDPPRMVALEPKSLRRKP